MARRQPLPDQELLNYSGRHVAYEIRMLRETEMLLAAIRNGVVKDALVESWVVHLRDLVEFLYPAGPQADDVIAADFFGDRADWQKIRPSLSGSLKKARERANKELAHLTTKRRGPGDPDKGWAVHDLTDELLRVLRKFGQNASKTKLHQNVRDALA